ncbi:uncharacterized protein LOC143071631 [Mytilus galloprovincialis]|uniref:uncharacterized protein LOC143071631 n=1 Tax=Mytilus galloprovincialis TaxID=29158 RepID=UPI003F7B4F1E
MRILLVCFLFGLSSILGDKCIVYKGDEKIPSLPSGARYGRTCHHVLGDKNIYCVELDCPKTDCSDPIVPETGYPRCNGTCVNGGRVFRENEHFICADGCNSCTCSFTTWMMCYKSGPPEICKSHEE